MGLEHQRPSRAWALLVALGLLVAGAGGVKLAEPPPPPPAPPFVPAPDGRSVAPVDLRTFEGPTLRLPLAGGPSIVHVWLQGCADCMPAFEAIGRLNAGGTKWPAPVVNVAFGSADPAWAKQYGLDQRLVFDPGDAVVRRLGIGTFTTLVLDVHGNVRHTDHPQDEGYLDRVRAAVAAAARPIGAPPPPPAPVAAAAPPPRARRGEWALGLGAALTLAGLGWRLSRLRPAALVAATRGALQPGPERALGNEVGVQAGQRCPYCHADVGGWDWVIRCDGCRTVLHEECARDLGVCPSSGCGRQIRSRARA